MPSIPSRSRVSFSPRYRPVLERLEDRMIMTAGLLDPTFGTAGYTVADLLATDQGKAAALQADGRIIVAGNVSLGGADQEFALARFTSAGVLDGSFNGSGKVFTDFGDGKEDALGVIVTADGKIVAVGRSFNGASSLAIARYNADGTLDTTFSDDGMLITQVGADSFATSVVEQEDGKLVVAGYADSQFLLTRYNPDGSLDTDFGTNGVTLTNLTAGIDSIQGIVLQEDGKIVAVGGTGFAFVRYNSDGSLDDDFGVNGKVVVDLPGSLHEARGVALQADGKIVAVGVYTDQGVQHMVVVRLTTEGDLDTTFNGAGLTTIEVAGQALAGQRVAIQATGKIVVTGYDHQAGGSRVVVARLRASGALETGFGTDGVTFTNVSSGNDNPYAVLIQGDGQIVVAGTANSGGSNSDIFVARYDGGSSSAPPVVSLGDAASTPQGVEFQREGSFTDGDSTSWTATVNFGAGGSTVPLTLNPDGSFSLAHTYVEKGVYTIQVFVTDDDGSVGIGTLEVTVFNQPPVVVVGTEISYETNKGAVFAVGGSFTDADSVSWTATVNYGDQSATVPLTLNADKTFTVSHVYTWSGIYTIQVAVSDDDGNTSIGELEVVVINPPPEVFAGPDGAVNEGVAFSQQGNFTDAGSTAWTATVDYGAGGGAQELILAIDGTYTLEYVYVHPGDYTITVTVTDEEGVSGSDTVDITVANVAPTASIAGPLSGVQGQPLTFTFSATDPPASAPDEVFTYQIDWDGDGTIDEIVSGGSELQVQHAFAVGVFTPTVLAIDAQDGVSALAAAAPITITAWALEADPINPNKTALVIGGTDQDDVIRVELFKNKKWRVWVNEEKLGVFPIYKRIIVYGWTGDDAITIKPQIKQSALLFGGDGNDTLVGGSGGDGLFGEDGNDVLKGRKGRDLLSGGAGLDQIFGGGGDDILISGSTSFDNDADAAAALLNEWKSTRPYAKRVANVRGTGAGPSFAARLNGNVFLTTTGSTPTVFDDLSQDTLAGQADFDLFFANAVGGVHDLLDRVAPETVVR